MKIIIDAKGGEFYVHFNEATFSANPDGVSVLFSVDELTQLADFANAELKDLGVCNEV